MTVAYDCDENVVEVRVYLKELEVVGAALMRVEGKQEPPYQESKACMPMDDPCIKRSLRASKGDVSKAAKLLQSMLTWRSELNYSTLTVSEFEPEIKSGKMYVQGNDAAGRSILVTRKRSEQPSDLGFDHYMRHLAFTLETASRQMKGGAEAWVWIMDMGCMTRANSPPLSTSMATLTVLSSHFPERLHTCFFVDAPVIFGYLWAALSPFIDAVTKQKVIFVKSSEWRARMAAKAAGGGEGGGAASAAAAGSAVVPDGRDFADYWSVFDSPYSEADYRALLSSFGWT
ncbi:hypothetical protein FOA52_016052 [Chlamydomonas sp. UWO 241]|nr:hypothetical protein FOA52_016052 [Chlamydomonas sp. UWO 241]